MFIISLKFPTIFCSCWPRISSSLSFFSHFLAFLHFNHSKRCKYNCAGNFFWPFFHHSLNIFIFSTFCDFRPSFPLSLFQIYNYNCTIPILQLQITFYNCRNCHQLHVKICPAIGLLGMAMCAVTFLDVLKVIAYDSKSHASNIDQWKLLAIRPRPFDFVMGAVGLDNRYPIDFSIGWLLNL